MNTQAWLKGILAAAIGGGAGVVVNGHVTTRAIGLGSLAMTAAYLAKSPLPDHLTPITLASTTLRKIFRKL